MLGMWEILGHSSPIPLLQHTMRIGHWSIFKFCNGVVRRKFSNDFNFGQSQNINSRRRGIIVNLLIQSSFPPIPFHSSQLSKPQNVRDIKFGNSVIIISPFSFFLDSSIPINSTPNIFFFFCINFNETSLK